MIHWGKSLLLVLLVGMSPMLYADSRPTIDDLLDRDIFIHDGFSGQSMTVHKDDNGYCVIRKYFGSGRPVIASVTYRARATGAYQIRFPVWPDENNDVRETGSHEDFILTIREKGGIQLLFHGLEVKTILRPDQPCVR